MRCIIKFHNIVADAYTAHIHALITDTRFLRDTHIVSTWSNYFLIYNTIQF